ncbi:MAG TPA: hypothetical protein VMM12_01535 [Longimicrobiales bacterium]|nr:hypothetical protein [Longimicrobiales bacterium]
MSEGGVRGIVVAHSDLAVALIQAVERIAGAEEGALVPLSNEGLGPEAICARLDELAGDGPAIVFADLREGSCGMAARRVCLGSGPARGLITGVNLPVLLDFVMKRHLPLEELVPRLVERGRASIGSGTESRP